MAIHSSRGTQLSVRPNSGSILEREAEMNLYSKGFKYIIGCDEAGRGPLAGPVVAASLVCLPTHTNLLEAADSKALSEKKRFEIYEAIKKDPTIRYAYSVISPKEIDELNILQATMLAMKNSIEMLIESDAQLLVKEIDKCYCLVDGNKSPKVELAVKPIVRGDALVYPIALASIIAKVERDLIMVSIQHLGVVVARGAVW